MDRENGELLFTGAEIAEKLREIAVKIVADLPSTADELVIVPIMDGAVVAARELEFYIDEVFGGCGPCLGGPSLIEKPINIARSKGTTLMEPKLLDFKWSETDFAGKPVVIIDDLVDEGETLKLARKTIERFRPAMLVTVALVKKADIDTPFLDYACFELKHTPEEARRHWLYGYGIDLDGNYRELGHIAQVLIEE
jgi:hypoxanthine-guanine phosphoribosyltransferase